MVIGFRRQASGLDGLMFGFLFYGKLAPPI